MSGAWQTTSVYGLWSIRVGRWVATVWASAAGGYLWEVEHLDGEPGSGVVGPVADAERARRAALAWARQRLTPG